jgi:hypothetical protein
MHAGRPETRPRTRGPHRVKFRAERAEQITNRRGLEHIKDRAAYFNTTPTTYSRVVRGLIDPGEEFIAAVLASHPGDPEITWDNLFEIVEVAP